MKFTAQKQDILTHTLLVERLCGKNLTLPVLNGVHIVAEESTLLLQATNLEVGIEISVPAKIEKNGSCVVPGSLLSQVLQNSFKGEYISFELEGGVLTVSSEDGKTTIHTIPDEEFPSLPHSQEGKTLSLEASEIVRGIHSVWYSASTSTIKPELSSVYIYHEGANIIFVSTDSFRLAEKKIPTKTKDSFEYFLIPMRNSADIAKVLETAKGEVSVLCTENQISFSFDSVYLTSRLIDGSFPDYKQIIPKEFFAEVTLLKADLMNACKKTNVFSDKFHQVQFSIQPNKKRVTVKAKNPDVGEAVTHLDAVIEGEELEISFNLRYLTDVFQTLTTDSVTLSFGGVGRPMVLTCVGDSSFRYLVMPMNR